MQPKARIILGVLYAVLAVSPVMATSPLERLVSNSPFGWHVREKSNPSEAPQIELRGVVHEGTAVYLTFFDPASKKWTTLSPGEKSDSFAVTEYNRSNESVMLDLQGRTLLLTLKPAGNQSYLGTAVAGAASNGATGLTASVAMTLQLPESESTRLEVVAAALKRRAEENQHQATPSHSASGA